MLRRVSPSPPCRPRGEDQATPQTPAGPRLRRPLPGLPGPPAHPAPALALSLFGLPVRSRPGSRGSRSVPGWCWGLVLGTQPTGFRAEGPGAAFSICFPRVPGEAEVAASPSWFSGLMHPRGDSSAWRPRGHRARSRAAGGGPRASCGLSFRQGSSPHSRFSFLGGQPDAGGMSFFFS